LIGLNEPEAKWWEKFKDEEFRIAVEETKRWEFSLKIFFLISIIKIFNAILFKSQESFTDA